MAVIALMMTLSASAQFYIYFSDGQIAQVDSISVRPIAYTITLNHSEIDLKVGEVRSLRAAVSPVVNNITHTINWTSSNPEVVRVNSSGEVTALAAGTATITATMDAEEVTPATCVVNVTNIAYTITLNHSEIELGVSETRKLSATVTPTSKEPIQWSSNNPGVATVNAAGVVEALSLGTAVITATIDAEVVTPATCIVNVTNNNDAVLNTFEIGGYALFDLGSPIKGTDTVIEISVGEVTCQLAPSLYYVWDKDIVLSSNRLSGAGYLMPVENYTYVITDSPNGAYNGYYIGGYDIVVDTIADEDILPYTGKAGKLLDVNMYGDAWDAILNLTEEPTEEEFNAAHDLYYASQTGIPFFHIDFNTGSQSYYYGNVSYLYLTEDRETSELYYDLKLEWYDHVNPNRWFGLLAEYEYDEEGDSHVAGIVKPYDMRVIHKHYQVLPPAEDAPARVQGKAKPEQYTISNQKLSLEGIPQLPSLKKIK